MLTENLLRGMWPQGNSKVPGLIEAMAAAAPTVFTAHGLNNDLVIAHAMAQFTDYGIDPATLIHALQNHDELTLELIHFWGAHKDDRFAFRGGQVTGAELRTTIHKEMYESLIGSRAPYNLKSGDGIACTTPSLIAATLGLSDVSRITQEQADEIGMAGEAHAEEIKDLPLGQLRAGEELEEALHLAALAVGHLRDHPDAPVAGM